jgi:hypothetical protein
MASNTTFFVEFLFFDVVALGWAGWELWSIRRSKDKPPADAHEPPPSEEPPRHPEG